MNQWQVDDRRWRRLRRMMATPFLLMGMVAMPWILVWAWQDGIWAFLFSALFLGAWVGMVGFVAFSGRMPRWVESLNARVWGRFEF